MKGSVRVISIVFTVFMILFLLYQILSGSNPFFDEVHPYLVYIAFIIFGGIGIFLSFRDADDEAKPKQEDKKEKL